MGDVLRRSLAVLCAGQGLFLVSMAEAADNGVPSHLNNLITQHAKANGLPEDLVHKVVRAESTYNPRAFHRGNYGLMQIRYGTARALGYTGPPSGLLDANTNLTYGVRYLAGAYRVAGGVASRAIAFYRRGYYFAARKLRRGKQPEVLTAEAPAPTPPALAQPVSLPGPTLSLFALPGANPAPSVPQILQPAGQPAAPLSAQAAEPVVQAGKTAQPGGAAQPAAPAARTDEASNHKDKPHSNAKSLTKPAAQGVDAGQASKPPARPLSQLVRPVSQSAAQTKMQPAAQELARPAAQPADEAAAKPARRKAPEQAKPAKKAGPEPRAEATASAGKSKGARRRKEADATATVQELRR